MDKGRQMIRGEILVFQNEVIVIFYDVIANPSAGGAN